MKNETNRTDKTTFSTWGRVAEDHMDRMSDAFAQATKFQASALEQGKVLFAHNMKLASDCQAWATETGNNLRTALFATK
jgi:hypothetical protein